MFRKSHQPLDFFFKLDRKCLSLTQCLGKRMDLFVSGKANTRIRDYTDFPRKNEIKEKMPIWVFLLRPLAPLLFSSLLKCYYDQKIILLFLWISKLC